MLTALGADAVPVRRPQELADVDGLVLPGGESSTIDKLSAAFGMRRPIRTAIAAGLPIYGTCAGMILLANRIEDGIAGQQTFGGLDVTVRRNAFGAQSESFEIDLTVPALGDAAVHAVFIRAPVVTEAGSGVTRLAALADGRLVAVEQGHLLATSFHPEATGETRFHQRLLEMIADSAA